MGWPRAYETPLLEPRHLNAQCRVAGLLEFELDTQPLNQPPRVLRSFIVPKGLQVADIEFVEHGLIMPRAPPPWKP